MERKRIAEATKGVGKPKVGGPFKLVDQDGKEFSSEDLKGKYSLVYFGFSHCPDICPEGMYFSFYGGGGAGEMGG